VKCIRGEVAVHPSVARQILDELAHPAWSIHSSAAAGTPDLAVSTADQRGGSFAQLRLVLARA
jgi:hypothetical protein